VDDESVASAVGESSQLFSSVADIANAEGLVLATSIRNASGFSRVNPLRSGFFEARFGAGEYLGCFATAEEAALAVARRAKEGGQARDEWLQCDACRKWRRLPFGTTLPDDDEWTCAMNPDEERNSCEVIEAVDERRIERQVLRSIDRMVTQLERDEKSQQRAEAGQRQEISQVINGMIRQLEREAWRAAALTPVEVQRQAEAEGLALAVTDHGTGFKGVTRRAADGFFDARYRDRCELGLYAQSASRNLGFFATAEEAALMLARYEKRRSEAIEVADAAPAAKRARKMSLRADELHQRSHQAEIMRTEREVSHVINRMVKQLERDEKVRRAEERAKREVARVLDRMLAGQFSPEVVDLGVLVHAHRRAAMVRWVCERAQAGAAWALPPGALAIEAPAAAPPAAASDAGDDSYCDFSSGEENAQAVARPRVSWQPHQLLVGPQSVTHDAMRPPEPVRQTTASSRSLT
jgi:hypothetical protein